MLIIHNYNLIIKKTNEKPIVIKKHSLSFSIPLEQILYIAVQNLDYPVICPFCNQEIKIRDSKRRYIKERYICKYLAPNQKRLTNNNKNTWYFMLYS